MPKRKRDDAQEEEAHAEPIDRALDIRKTRLQVKIDQGNKPLTTALKLARGFERQKLGRRQKAAKDEGKELLRLKEEVICLKTLDLALTAKNHLFKQLVRTKRIKESVAFQSLYREGVSVEAPKPGAEANVVGRLFNSAPVKEVLPGIMNGIYGCLGLEKGDKATSGAVGDPPNSQKQTEEAPPDSYSKSHQVEDDHVFSTEDESLGTLSDIGHSDDGEEDEGDLTGYRHRLASFSPSSSSETSVDEKTGHANSRAPGGNGPAPTLSASLSDAPTPSTSTSPSPPPKPSKSKATAPKTLSSTTFLPSLTVGGYYSGSESGDDQDPYLHDGDAAGGAATPQLRKNRRGQRARQQIAEKKFGKGANHLKKRPMTAKPTAGRDTGWDAKRGATTTEGGDSKGSGRRGRLGASGHRGRPARNTTGPTGANGDAVNLSKRRGGAASGQAKQQDGPLHPSWEAAKKRKEQGQKISTSSMAASSGKKIVFGD